MQLRSVYPREIARGPRARPRADPSEKGLRCASRSIAVVNLQSEGLPTQLGLYFRQRFRNGALQHAFIGVVARHFLPGEVVRTRIADVLQDIWSHVAQIHELGRKLLGTCPVGKEQLEDQAWPPAEHGQSTIPAADVEGRRFACLCGRSAQKPSTALSTLAAISDCRSVEANTNSSSRFTMEPASSKTAGMYVVRSTMS